jgi:hypothetical protein
MWQYKPSHVPSGHMQLTLVLDLIGTEANGLDARNQTPFGFTHGSFVCLATTEPVRIQK